jgi:hypothetical protein
MKFMLNMGLWFKLFEPKITTDFLPQRVHLLFKRCRKAWKNLECYHTTWTCSQLNIFHFAYTRIYFILLISRARHLVCPWDQCQNIRTWTRQAIAKYNYCVSGHYPLSCFYLKHNVSETRFCLCLQVEPTQLDPSTDLVSGPEMGASSINLAQLSRFHLKMETESSLWNVCFK